MQLKVCGIKTIKEIEILNKTFPRFVGFVFADSRWHVSVSYVKVLLTKLSPKIKTIAVFRGNMIDEIIEVSKFVDMVQIHEDEDFIVKAKKSVNVPVIKGIKVESQKDINFDTVADFILFDGGIGGQGKMFDWTLLSNINKPFILADGITIENAKLAITYNHWAIDVLSGARTNGKLDENKVRRLTNLC
ncbi:MAG: phosphoribosylanthranilate isomerase [Endomicrobium sp.]|nr:phosphoribosylanthranilate isomerase [Endomicrobium sp.]